MPLEKAYGLWKSPITSEVATERSVQFDGLAVDRAYGKQGIVYWSEVRYDEEGRSVVCKSVLGSSDYTSLTPPQYNARTTVHEYGGGAFTVHGGVVYFSNFKDQCIYRQVQGKDPELITDNSQAYRYANGFYSEQHGLLYAVREDHSDEKKEAVATIVCINPDTKEQSVLISGCDFYASPKISPNGKSIIWIQWNHPNMPWDSTELRMATLTSSGTGIESGSEKVLVAGDVSVMQPCWVSDTQLLYISDLSDYWNLYLLDCSTEQHVNLIPKQQEMGRARSRFDENSYDYDVKNNRIIVTFGPTLGVYDFSSKQYREVNTGYSGHSFVGVAGDGHVYCVAGSPTHFNTVVRINVDTAEVTSIRESNRCNINRDYFSIPKEISWPTDGGQKSYGYLYLPKNVDYVAPEGTLPPLLVNVHGGPTSQCFCTLSLLKQYFTTRGFAILDVNYRGSTGYGKQYRNALKKNWGIYDVQDCCSGAQYLVDQGLVNKDHLCIDGGSAGGYTTLACLAFKDTFRAGASSYGIADLDLLAVETHKFESQYMNGLVADYTDENKHVYRERSPIYSVDSFNCPVAFFQGDEDKIVPPNQAETMYKAIKDKGLPCALVMFKGEQHGFRVAENIQKALDGELYFFTRVFGIGEPDVTHKIDIDNLN